MPPKNVASTPPSLKVVPYTKDNLLELFSKDSTRQIISKRQHLDYFNGYFQHSDINAKTILAENNYIDRDFLEDFAGYYVRCFSEYDRICRRLHFFENEFSLSDFEKLLIGEPSNIERETLQKGYLGFIVIKPLPETVVGKTCLKTYQIKNSSRSFPPINTYSVSLFGIPLKVNSLAFQEQDQVVAACATSSLWSLFQATGQMFQHSIPSPMEITKSATVNLYSMDRVFPNKKGLVIEQMADAIRNVKLEPNFISLNKDHFAGDQDLNNSFNNRVLKSTLYAYLNYGIPVIFVFEVWNTTPSTPIFMGWHGVTVVGFKLDESKIQTENLEMKSSGIDRIYVHDDQVGPFARMIFDEEYSKINGKFSIHTSWGSTFDASQNCYINHHRAIPHTLIVPLYHKIRIPFWAIYGVVEQFDGIFESYRSLITEFFPDRLQWDIQLISISKLKEEIFVQNNITGDYKKELLIQKMPRYIWRARGYLNNEIALDLLFDATDIEQGGFFIRAIEYDTDLAKVIKIISGDPNLESQCEDTSVVGVFKWFKD